MYKERLMDLVTERYMNDQINTDKFLRLAERIDEISEGRALDFLTEAKASAISKFGKKAWTATKKYSGASKQAEWYKKLLAAKKKGNKGEAAKIAAKMVGLGLVQGGTVGAAGYGGYRLAKR